MGKKAAIRDKTRQGCLQHLTERKPTDTRLLLGDSHIERLVWRFPHLAPQNTWLCGIGGDRVSQLQWRVANDEGLGYTQHSSTAGSSFTHIGIMIGSNDITSTSMKPSQIASMVAKVTQIYSAVQARWPDAIISVFPVPPVPNCGKKERHTESVTGYNVALMESPNRLVAEGLDWTNAIDLDTGFEDHVHMAPEGYSVFLERCVQTFFGLTRKSDAAGKDIKADVELSELSLAESSLDNGLDVDLDIATPADLERVLEVSSLRLEKLKSASGDATEIAKVTELISRVERLLENVS
ncbi:hypothetical protein HDU97_001186 [Phlyctochytrium planicorne]|nr:hypothetical protein HDU97_001186 [Phlyctochytrium planicorne]